MFCSKCGSPNAEGAAFCAKCGNPLAAAGAATGSSGPGTSPGPSSPGSGSFGTGSAATSSPGATAPAPDTTTMRGHATATPRSAVGKNPTVALVLSIFLGAFGGGQFYNGDWKKGLAMVAGTLILGIATGGLASLGIWIWSMIDAYQVASGKWSIW